MPAAAIKPTHKALATYYQTLQSYAGQQVTHEGALETAFQQLLIETARPHGWMLVPKQPIKRGGRTIIPDGTFAGIPPETFRYRLGNRSALDWFIDQYQVSEDKRSGIRSDPNRPSDPEYIIRLVGQIIRVSLENVRIVESLPAFA